MRCGKERNVCRLLAWLSHIYVTKTASGLLLLLGCVCVVLMMAVMVVVGKHDVARPSVRCKI